MAASLVQWAAAATDSSGSTPTFSGASTAGNLLVLISSGGAENDTTVPTLPGGWTNLYSALNTSSGGGSFHGLWWKISTGDTSVTVTAGGIRGAVLGEISGAGALVADGAARNTGGASGGFAAWVNPTGVDTGVRRLEFFCLCGDDDWGPLGLPAGVTSMGHVLWSQREVTTGFKDTAVTSPPLTYTSVLPSGGYDGFHLAAEVLSSSGNQILNVG
jgi:hypothetical protein